MVYKGKSINLSYNGYSKGVKGWGDLTHMCYIVGLQGKSTVMVTKGVNKCVGSY
tara:strand:+ start:48 stop:209 length:162 start_codon:yes stop_codon:yes gene_type:complete